MKGLGVDPTTMAVLFGWLDQIVNEMDDLICMSAFSPTISEGYDRASGIYTSTGNLIAQGCSGLPSFTNTMPDAVKNIIEIYKGNLSPGDIILYNDPYIGGTHLMDVKLFKPIFQKGELTYWVGTTGHWPDIGGSFPGGFGSNVTEIFQEGLTFPGVKLYEKGKLNEGLVALILANVRVPEERFGDLKAQVGVLNIGERRLKTLLHKYRGDTVAFYVAHREDMAERHLRSYIREIPDSTYSATDYLDNDGYEDKPIKIHVDITVDRDNMTFDFSKSSPPVTGPMNCGRSIIPAACFFFLKHTFPDIPINSGIYRPLKFILGDTFLNAKFPRPVSGAAAEVSNRIYDVCTLALSEALPKELPAQPFATINNVAIAGKDLQGKDFVMYIYTGGGYGGYDGGDGFPYGAPPSGTSRVQPYEVFEHLYPMRTKQFSLREDSGGKGQYRGGFGAVIEVELLAEATVGALGDRTKFAPKGILGGKDALRNEMYIIRNTGKKYEFPLGAKGMTTMRKGDVLVIKTPGGGGYGNPAERERELILKDVVNGFIDRETAEKAYNITISDEELKAIRKKM